MNKLNKVILLPIEKTSNIALYQESTSNDKPILQLVNHTSSDYKYQHLYVISDDKIEVGDYMINNNQDTLVKCNVAIGTEHFKKVIATSDNLIAKINKNIYERGEDDILPQISESFIKLYIDSYNKGTIIQECLIEYEKLNMDEIREQGKGFLHANLDKLKLNDNNKVLISLDENKIYFTKDEVHELLKDLTLQMKVDDLSVSYKSKVEEKLYLKDEVTELIETFAQTYGLIQEGNIFIKNNL